MDKSGSSANALGDQFMDSATKAMDLCDQLYAEKKIRAAVITSAKDTFCVGADLEQVYPITDEAEARKLSQTAQQFFERLADTKYPVIAAINGMALGGGCELALACHHRVISSTAAIGLPETLIGLLPGAGGTVRLQRLIGVQNALKIILAGKSEKADKAVKLGIADAVAQGIDKNPNEYLFFKEARAFCEKVLAENRKPSKGKKKSFQDRLLEDTSIGRRIIANQSVKTLNKQTKGKYIASYKALECVLFAAGHAHKEALDFEAKKFAELCVSPEAKNQIALFFLDDGMKKVDKKTGVNPSEIPKVKKVGVMGAGVMGSGISHYFALKDHKVYMKDLKQEFVDKGLAFVRGEFEASYAKKKIDDAKLQKYLTSVTGGTKDDDFKTCDVVIEAAVEVMDVKKKMLQQLEQAGILDGKRLFATNTSSLSITELQSVSKYPECVVGMHFF
ncbi:MAG: enoyl-CoA hydratase/isomerase family protein, partial [Simkania sp.]|nr:enoyl-CoA hydratase/isomerase family protein [Simkania sp.]